MRVALGDVRSANGRSRATQRPDATRKDEQRQPEQSPRAKKIFLDEVLESGEAAVSGEITVTIMTAATVPHQRDKKSGVRPAVDLRGMSRE